VLSITGKTCVFRQRAETVCQTAQAAGNRERQTQSDWSAVRKPFRQGFPHSRLGLMSLSCSVAPGTPCSPPSRAASATASRIRPPALGGRAPRRRRRARSRSSSSRVSATARPAGARSSVSPAGCPACTHMTHARSRSPTSPDTAQRDLPPLPLRGLRGGLHRPAEGHPRRRPLQDVAPGQRVSRDTPKVTQPTKYLQFCTTASPYSWLSTGCMARLYAITPTASLIRIA